MSRLLSKTHILHFWRSLASLLNGRSRHGGTENEVPRSGAEQTQPSSIESEDDLWSQLPFAPDPLYDRLFSPLSQGEIRLVRIHGGSKHEVIKCSLKVVSLSACPSYEALSYRWGSNRQLETVQLDGHDFDVTPNLAAALRKFRKRKNRLLWIDQLCVNQTDMDERNEQVPVMGQIYSQARKVLVWLGVDSHQEAPLAQQLIRDLCSNLSDKQNPGGDDGVRNPFGGLALITDQVLQNLHLPPRASPMWRALNHLVELPYFGRVWIVQEIHFAASMEMHWGDTKISYQKLLKVLPWFLQVQARALFRDYLLDPSAVSLVLDLKASPKTFEQALSMTAQRNCGDARDRVFGILGIVAGGAPFVSDYHRSLMEVYLHTTYQLLNKTMDLRCLTHIDNSELLSDASVDDFKQWPSWIPTSWQGVVGQSDYTFHACGVRELATFSGAMIDLDTSPPSMTIKGFRQGKIRTLGMFASEGAIITRDNELETTILKITEAWQLMLQEKDNSIPLWRYTNFPKVYKKYFEKSLNDPPLMAFLRTMLCGTEDLEILGRDKESARGRVHFFDSNRYLSFAQSWITILSAYLGVKGPMATNQVKQSLCIARVGLADIVGIRIPLQHDALEGQPLLLPLDDDDLREKYESKVREIDQSRLVPRIRVSNEIFSASEGTFDASSPEIADTVDELVYAACVGMWRDNSFLERWRRTGLYKRFFITDNGFMGMGPKAMREGDLFVIFGGGTVPFVIRPCDGDGYRIIGSCYIEGVMGGKLVEELHYFDDLREMVEMFKIV